MRRRRPTWEQQHQAWLATPVGRFESAFRDCVQKSALGPLAHVLDEREALARIALAVATEQGWTQQIADVEWHLADIAQDRTSRFGVSETTISNVLNAPEEKE